MEIWLNDIPVSIIEEQYLDVDKYYPVSVDVYGEELRVSATSYEDIPKEAYKNALRYWRSPSWILSIWHRLWLRSLDRAKSQYSRMDTVLLTGGEILNLLQDTNLNIYLTD